MNSDLPDTSYLLQLSRAHHFDSFNIHHAHSFGTLLSFHSGLVSSVKNATRGLFIAEGLTC